MGLTTPHVVVRPNGISREVDVVYDACNKLVFTPTQDGECLDADALLARSTDGGVTWQNFMVAGGPGQQFGSDATAGSDGTLYVLFDNQKAKTEALSVKLAEIPQGSTTPTIFPVTTKMIVPSINVSSGGDHWGANSIKIRGTTGYAGGTGVFPAVFFGSSGFAGAVAITRFTGP